MALGLKIHNLSEEHNKPTKINYIWAIQVL
jgi:hypothetical protein